MDTHLNTMGQQGNTHVGPLALHGTKLRMNTLELLFSHHLATRSRQNSARDGKKGNSLKDKMHPTLHNATFSFQP